MIYKFNNFETEFDNTDVDFLEKYENESAKLANRQLPAEGIAAFAEGCDAINEFFDNIFGENASSKMFGGKRSFKEHIAAVTAIKKAVANTEELDMLIKELGQ